MKLTVEKILNVAFIKNIQQVETTIIGKADDATVECTTYMHNVHLGQTYEGRLETAKNGIIIFKREWNQAE